jgi:hypothetical protein
VSLILDALRKLEREKSAQEPGVLVVGSVPWGERSRASRLALAAGALLVVAAAVLAGWLLRRGPAPAPPSHPVAPAAAPTPLSEPSAAAPASPAPSAEPEAKAADPPPPIRLSHAPAAAARERAPERTAPASEATAPGRSPAQEIAPDAAPTPSPAAHATPAKGAEELRLSAISQRDGKPVALINDRLLFEGDSFDGVRVVRIGETEVEVEVRGQRKILRF